MSMIRSLGRKFIPLHPRTLMMRGQEKAYSTRNFNLAPMEDVKKEVELGNPMINSFSEAGFTDHQSKLLSSIFEEHKKKVEMEVAVSNVMQIEDRMHILLEIIEDRLAHMEQMKTLQMQLRKRYICEGDGRLEKQKLILKNKFELNLLSIDHVILYSRKYRDDLKSGKIVESIDVLRSTSQHCFESYRKNSKNLKSLERRAARIKKWRILSTVIEGIKKVIFKVYDFSVGLVKAIKSF